MLTDPDREFLARHARLLADPEAVLPCCFYDATMGAYCNAEATHGVVATVFDPWGVTTRKSLPYLRDEYEKQGEPPRLRQHPEFCAAHAEVVCLQRQGTGVSAEGA